jgi:hypothetical protein
MSDTFERLKDDATATVDYRTHRRGWGHNFVGHPARRHISRDQRRQDER